MQTDTRNSIAGAGIGTIVGAGAGVAASKLVKLNPEKAWTNFVSEGQAKAILNHATKDVFESSTKEAKKGFLGSIKGLVKPAKQVNILEKADGALQHSEEFIKNSNAEGMAKYAKRWGLNFTEGETTAKQLVDQLSAKTAQAEDSFVNGLKKCRKANFIIAGAAILATAGAIVAKVIANKKSNTDKTV